MAIEFYSGTPGSGKSLHTAYKMIDWLRSGRSCIANFDIDLSYFKKKKIGTFIDIDTMKMNVNQLKCFARFNHEPFKENQTLLIIDECSVIFNCRSWDAKSRMEWINFFQQHRKLGYSILLISPNDKMIDKQIRAFIETEYKHRAIKHYKLFGSILSLVLGGLFISIEYWYGAKIKAGSEMFTFNKRKAKIFDSYKIFE